jgi:LacI family transcriptional regulator
MNGNKITIKQIAESTGVSRSTVSRALRNDPRISAAVRRKIQKKAAEYGYKPDPQVSELMRYLKKRRTETKRSAIAWINHRNEEDFWSINPWAELFLHACRESAEANGYHLDEIWLGPYERYIPEKRIVQILTARGIKAVLIPPFIDRRFPWTLPWEKFCAVSIGSFPFEPRMPFVDSDDYHNTLLCCRMLRALGKQRIGLILFAEHIGEDNPITAAVLQEAFIRNTKPCPPLLLPDRTSSQASFLKWFGNQRPDCIISDAPQTVQKMMDAEGLTERTGLVHLNAVAEAEKVNWSGIDKKQAALCAAAVEQLTARLQSNQYGLPENAVNILMKGSWIPGETAG